MEPRASLTQARRPSVTELHLQPCRLVIFKGHTGHVKSEKPSVPLTTSHEASARVCTVWELICFRTEGLRDVCVLLRVPALLGGTVV